MKRGWWSINEKADIQDGLVFPNFGEDGIDLDLFNRVIKSTIPLNEVDREHIVSLVKQGYVSGEVIQ